MKTCGAFGLIKTIASNFASWTHAKSTSFTSATAKIFTVKYGPVAQWQSNRFASGRWEFDSPRVHSLRHIIEILIYDHTGVILL